MNKMGRSMAETQQGIVLQNIQPALQEKPEVAQQVWCLINSGSLEKEHKSDDDMDCLPRTSNKWRALSISIMKWMLVECEP